MDVQQQVATIAIRTPLERLQFVARSSLNGGLNAGLGRRGLQTGLASAAEAALALIGLSALAVASYQGLRRASQVRPEGLVVLTAAAYFVGLAALIHVAWDRYLVPTAALAALLGGLGVGALAQQTRALVGRVRFGRLGEVRRRYPPLATEPERGAQGTPAD
jgi:hypothetical protein